MKTLMIVLFLFVSPTVLASVYVAFFEARTPDGERIILEPDGKFYHMAIRYQNQWLHVHPRNGVELTDEVSGLGRLSEVLVHPSPDEPSEDFVRAHLGKPFNVLSSCHDKDQFNCATLPGLWFEAEPQEATFQASVWNGLVAPEQGIQSLSPDDMYNHLKQLGFKSLDEHSSCASKLFDWSRRDSNPDDYLDRELSVLKVGPNI